MENYLSLFDDYGDLREGNSIQLCFLDLDDDGEKELIIAAGDDLINLSVSIYKYNPTAKSLEESPYAEVGKIEGQRRILITKDKKINVFYGSQGLYDTYIYKEGILKRE
jgi:hypothetical protein